MKLKEKEDICYLFKWKIVKWKCNFFLYGFSLKIVISLDMLKKKGEIFLQKYLGHQNCLFVQIFLQVN